MRDPVDVMEILRLFIYFRLCLNEARKNLAANLGRSPLMHSYGYASADDRSALFVRGVPKQRVPAPHPFGANAKNRSGRFFARFPLTKSPGAILNALKRGPQGGGQDARSSFVPYMQYTG